MLLLCMPSTQGKHLCRGCAHEGVLAFVETLEPRLMMDIKYSHNLACDRCRRLVLLTKWHKFLDGCWVWVADITQIQCHRGNESKYVKLSTWSQSE